MPVAICCPSCGKKGKAHALALLGNSVRCPHCRRTFVPRFNQPSRPVRRGLPAEQETSEIARVETEEIPVLRETDGKIASPGKQPKRGHALLLLAAGAALGAVAVLLLLYALGKTIPG